ncbi:ArsR/SmtB family transcription factor [Paenibacillus sp. TH7-28]
MPDTFAVIAEPSRRRILDLLLQSESNVTDLAQALGLSQPLVSKHLRTLRQSGLVKVRVKSQQHIYSLEAEPLAEIDEWLKAYRKKWNRHVDALENFLDQQKKD